ncbi:MAG: methyltransferase domain-containing protein [Syntrophobacteraceae bacterium]
MKTSKRCSAASSALPVAPEPLECANSGWILKNHIRKFYEHLYLSEDAGARGVGGKPLALELGYPQALVEALPDKLWKDFLPCGNVLSLIRPKDGDRVLNLGCGVGVDSILLKMSQSAHFSVFNLDTAYPALLKARDAAKGLVSGRDFQFLCAEATALAFPSDCFDWIMLNGVFNLFPDKGELIEEINRVSKPGAILAGADLCRKVVLPGYFASEPDAWAWCMSGALSRDELLEAFEKGGFSMLSTVGENMDEFFDRVAFSFRKIQSALDREPKNPGP